jgi:hypothetical protein
MLKTISSVFFKSTLVTVSCCFALPVMAQSAPKSTSINGYPADFVPKSTERCVQNATAKGVKPEIAQTRCSCLYTQLQAKIPFEKFKVMATEAQKTGKPSPELQAISKSCPAK